MSTPCGDTIGAALKPFAKDGILHEIVEARAEVFARTIDVRASEARRFLLPQAGEGVGTQ